MILEHLRKTGRLGHAWSINFARLIPYYVIELWGVIKILLRPYIRSSLVQTMSQICLNHTQKYLFLLQPCSDFTPTILRYITKLPLRVNHLTSSRQTPGPKLFVPIAKLVMKIWDGMWKIKVNVQGKVA